MKDASLGLLQAVRAALIADTDVAALVGERVASSFGTPMTPPFLRLHIPAVIQFEADDDTEAAASGSETIVNVHVFTKEPAPIILHDLAAKVRQALQDNDGLTVEDADLWMVAYKSTIKRQDASDPGLQMAVVSFTAFTTE